MARTTRFRIVRAKDEQQLRDAVQQLLANGYDMGSVSGIVLDAMGILQRVTADIRRAKEARDIEDA